MTTQKIRIEKKFDLPSATIEFWNNGIIYFKLADDYEIELEDSIRHSEIMLENPPEGFKKYLVLVEPGIKSTITKEARENSEKSKAHKLTQAMAVVSKSLSQRIIVNFIFRYFKQQGITVKLFSTREEALKWLLNFTRE